MRYVAKVNLRLQTSTEIYEQLSPKTRLTIDEVRSLHEQDGRMSYSVLNLAGIAELVPQYAERILDDKCVSVFESFQDFSPKDLTLREDIPTMVPIVAGESRVHVVEGE